MTPLSDRIAAWAAAWQEAQKRWREATPYQRAQIGLATRKGKTRLDRGKHKQYATLNKAREKARRKRQIEHMLMGHPTKSEVAEFAAAIRESVARRALERDRVKQAARHD